MPTQPAAPRTTTSYAILGLLSVRDWSTYELAKQVRRSLRWFWPRTERKLYDEPKRLVADGLATATKQYTGQRPRTVYGITEHGREQLRRWLDEPPATRSMEFEGMLSCSSPTPVRSISSRPRMAAIERGATSRLAELAEVNHTPSPEPTSSRSGCTLACSPYAYTSSRRSSCTTGRAGPAPRQPPGQPPAIPATGTSPPRSANSPTGQTRSCRLAPMSIRHRRPPVPAPPPRRPGPCRR